MKMHKSSCFVLSGLLGLFVAPPLAQAGCNNASVILTPPGYVFNINPSPQLSVAVTRADNGDCRYFIGFSNGRAPTYALRRLELGAATIPLNIYKDAAHTRILKDKPVEAISADDVLYGQFVGGPGSNTQTLNYWAGISPGSDYSLAGIYLESITANLYSGSVTGSYHFESSSPLVFAYYVPMRVDLSIVDTGAPFNLNSLSQDLNFGTLATGQTRTLDLVLQYNAGFRLSFSSENNGVLKHSTRANAISYGFQLAGTPVSLNGSATHPIEAANGNGVSPASGARYPLRVTIGSIANAVAGAYFDNITITVVSAD